MLAAEWVWINPDHFLQTPAGRVWTPERSKEAWQQAYAALRTAVTRLSGQQAVLHVVCGIQGSGKSSWVRAHAEGLAPCVLFDAALPRAVHRAPVIAIARQSCMEARAVWLDTSVETARERNGRRPPDERVPEAAIRSVAAQLEEPSLAEGFTRILRVQEPRP